MIYSFTGEKVETLADLQADPGAGQGTCCPHRPSDKVWLPYLGNTLDAGVATLFACEIIEACKYLIGPNPVDGIWLGAANDVIMRERGIEFVDGTAPGFAAIAGAAPDQRDRRQDRPRAAGEEPLRLHGRHHQRHVSSPSSWPRRACSWAGRRAWCPSARTSRRSIYALGFANRAALSFGGVKPGDFKAQPASTTRTASSPSCWPWARSTTRSTPPPPAPSTTASRPSPTPTSRRSCPPASAPTSTWSPTCRYEPDRREGAGGARLQDQDHQGADPGALRPGLRGRAHPQGADVHVEFGGNTHAGLRVRDHARSMDEIEDGEIEIIGPDIDDVPAGHRAAAGHLGGGGRAARCRPTSSRSSSARSTT